MKRRKTLKELTLKENFMFSAVMITEPENCRRLLEMALDIKIERVEVDREKSLIYNPEYRGVRLDVYASDEQNTRYDVEMQVQRMSLPKRARYYHSQMDMDVLLSGEPYEKLPNSYVLFLCDFDPFGQGKYRYTRKQYFKEAPEYEYDDGSYTVYLSTEGKNASEVPKELVSFLTFLRASLEESEQDFEDPYVNELQHTIRQIKASREMGERYMLLEDKCPIEIAEELEEDVELVERICETASAFAPEYDVEGIYEKLNEK